MHQKTNRQNPLSFVLEPDHENIGILNSEHKAPEANILKKKLSLIKQFGKTIQQDYIEM